MPELPEVETVKRTLEKHIIGLTITQVDIIKSSVIRSHPEEEFKNILVGKKITQIKRRGKYLILIIQSGLAMVIHLRMTGRLVYLTEKNTLPKYTHVLFHFNNETELAFADMRRFGFIQLLPEEDLSTVSGLKDLGPEPLSDNFDPDYLAQQFKNKRGKIKPLLLNQHIVAGLGNIYVDEALFLSQIHPEKLGYQLSGQEIANLYQAIVTVLKQGIENRGTSFRDYVDGEGNLGQNQNMLKAYHREGQPCENCGTLLIRVKVAGRSSFFCPNCQQL